MNVRSYLKRSHKTNLIDEELLILDVLFDASDIFESFVKENYASWHNLPYSHDQETGPLRELIEKLISDSIIKIHTSADDSKVFYALTETGGKLWEAERVPDWGRYCTDSSTVDEKENWILSVESPSIITARAFVDCANDCFLYRFNQADNRTTTLSEGKISTVDWRAFSTVCSVSVPSYPLSNPHPVDWNEYERKRTWWRNLTELAKFQKL
jgi:hypothetical protein